MILKEILAISGEQGLFKFIAQGKNAIIVEHFETKKRSIAHNSAKVSSLEDISIFTRNEDIPLGRVFDKIYEKENGGPAIDSKAPVDKLIGYFEEVVPDYDEKRVYASDIKKVFLWYNILQKLDLFVREKTDEPAVTEKSETEVKPVIKSKSKTGPKSKSTKKTESKAASTIGKAKPKSK